MIINPVEEIKDLEEDIDFIESKIEELESADSTNLTEIDKKALEIYTEMSDLAVELLEAIEDDQEMVQTGDVSDAGA